ncbi:asparaginase [Roseateles paludis]|uniref:Asparaginase n=1 Tax=Roseateles paludis TaxID=3145238 RepID=A0ABV0G6Z0_9BURK
MGLVTGEPVVVEVLRGETVESRHLGALAVVDAAGALHTAWGDIDRPVFPRSAVKLLQALPLVTSGAADAFALSDAELALACASHSGEPAHVATAQGWLTRLDLSAEHLECGTQWPAREPVLRALVARGEVAGPLHNNCSGKHCGFLCLACHLGHQSGAANRAGFARGYVAPEHPVMREVTHALEVATGQDLARAPRGIDGCSIPTYALPLRALALAFARVGTGSGLPPDVASAAARLRRAVAQAPFMVGGTDRFDTEVMQALGERLCCKVGAEGVYCASLPELGLGLALKIDDGASRAAEAVMAQLALRLLRPSGDAATLLQRLAAPVMRNWRGTEVGRLRMRLEG